MNKITSMKIDAIKKIAVNGTELNYIESGKGTPLIFVHGSLGDFNTFNQQFKSFSEHYHIIAYSRRFHPPNKLSINDKIYSMAQQVEDLASLITNLNLPSVHIIASSYGAYTSLILTLKYPSLVRTLTLGEPPLLPLLTTLPEGEAILNSFMKNVLIPCTKAFMSGDKEDGIRTFIDGIRSPGNFDQISIEGRRELMKNADTMSLEMLTNPELYFIYVNNNQLNEIKVPVLIVNGEKSPAFLHKISEILEAEIPNNQVTTITNAGHSMYRDNSKEFNQKVLNFLSKH